MKYLIAIFLLFIATSAYSVVIWTGDGTGNTTPPADDPGWVSVGVCGFGTCEYLGNGWVMTARHIGQANVVFDGIEYNYVQGSRTQLPSDAGASHSPDVVLWKVYPYPTVPALPLYDRKVPVGTPVIGIGHGFNRGAIRPPGAALEDAVGWEPGTGKSMRWGTNRVAESRNRSNRPIGYSSMTYTMIFDKGGTTRSTLHEDYFFKGDSGGPMFVRVPGLTNRWAIAGINVTTQDVNANYNAWIRVVDIPFYRDQLLAIVNTPACDNGIDDDMDGLIDYPEDDSCDDANDIEDTPLGSSLWDTLEWGTDIWG